MLVRNLIALMLFPLATFAQFSISGKVTSRKNGESLAGAAVVVGNAYSAVATNTDGTFVISNLKSGKYMLSVSMVGYVKYTDTVLVEANLVKDISLEEYPYVMDEVQIVAVRAMDKSGMATDMISKKKLEERNLGQDLPYLLNQSPSLVTTSDAGAGVGYTGFRIRGSDATRINVTINGIPVNDAESQGTYWVDMPDIASSVDNIQIQRGVGTSTNGAGAFGGSVNIQTTTLNPQPYATFSNSYGSFNTLKNTISLGTGLLHDKFVVDARLSRLSSDGYIQRAASNLYSHYLSGAYYGRSTTVKLITFSGHEKTYQAWYGVYQDSLATNRTFNPAGMLFDAAGNIGYYKDETDNYRQDYYQLHVNQRIAPKLYANLALHYTEGRGYYEEYKQGQLLADYGLAPVVTGADTVFTTDLVRKKWLDNDFYGTTYSLNYNSAKLNIVAGGAYNEYLGLHYGEITWASYSATAEKDQRYYQDSAFKTDLNNFIKANYFITPKLSVYGDLQYRTVSYSFMGFGNLLTPEQQKVKLGFFNPKAAVNYDISYGKKVYVSFAVGNKEPSRDDYVQSSPATRPVPENLQDIELGYRQSYGRISYGANLYYMNYKNQLVLTGQINDVGAYNRVNIAKSYRQGIELDAELKLFRQLTWNANFTYSKNKVQDFTEYADDYDNGGQIATQHHNTDLAFSPSVIAGSELLFAPVKGLSVSFLTKYVGLQYLDNTSNAGRSLDPYLVNDIRLAYSVKSSLFKEATFTLLLNNIFSELYESNGYTYSYMFGGVYTTENYYYPQAPAHYLAGITLKF